MNWTNESLRERIAFYIYGLRLRFVMRQWHFCAKVCEIVVDVLYFGVK